MKKKCIIVGASPLCGKITTQKDDFIIACDGGYCHLKNQNIKPHILIGDFDSIGEKIPSSIPVLQSPSEKDDTDAMLSIKYAIKKGFTHIDLYGLTGGRLDHQMASFSALSFIAEHGISAELIDDQTKIIPIKNSSTTFDYKGSFGFSVFSFSDVSTGVKIKNAKYLLENATLTSSFPLGTSNEFIGLPVTVSVENGTLFIFIQQ